MADFQNAYTKGKTLEELIDALLATAEPGSAIHEMTFRTSTRLSKKAFL